MPVFRSLLQTRLLITLLTALLSYLPATQAAETAPTAPAKVMLIGVFHFANPGLDAVKHPTIDVMTPASQAYLEQLTQQLLRFKPTKVLLEYDPTDEEKINQRYRDYLAGNYVLERNEIYQLGFRVAKHAGLASVHSFDERNTPWRSELWDYMPKHDPAMMASVEALIAKLSADGERAHTTMNLRELMQLHNDPEYDRTNKDFYLLINPVGAEQKLFHGADSAASWWHRNFRMYANIQLHAKPGERILVIGGQGHTAILRDLLDIDSRIDAEDPRPYL